MRRKLFLASARPELDVVDQRGNVPTRVAAVDSGVYDAIILAVAGLRRLGLGDRITEILDYDTMLPAAAQGALAVEVRADDDVAGEIVAVLDDPSARAEVSAERACLRRLEAGCQAPVGASGKIEGSTLRLRAAVAGIAGIVWAEAIGIPSEAEVLGTRAAEGLLEQLGLTTLRDAPWAGPPPRGPGVG